VGDGLLRLDRAGVVSYASPNAVSSYRRLGHTGNLAGESLRTVHAGLHLSGSAPERRGVDAAARRPTPQEDELQVDDIVVVLRAIPLLAGSERGALVLVRDVTELRRREAQLLRKDATIREIHHRVKNNLQTVAALLRLQARRTAIPEARRALLESVRRVNSIALVHESLSASVAERVDLDELVDKVLPAIGDGATADVRAKVRRDGSFGTLSAALATPLVLVLTELVHNALAHAFDPGTTGEVVVTARRCAGTLDVIVADDGNGLPPGFDVDASAGLGLSIVRTLLESELDSTLSVRPRPGGGTEALITLSLRGR
jgi:two-component sensor histidine kinase